MKKATKIWLIVAAALMTAGVLLCGVCFAALGFDVGRFETVKYETNEYTIEEGFEHLSIKVETANVTFVPSSDGVCRVVCFEKEKLMHEVSVVDGTLTVTYRDARKWYDYISFSFRSPSLTVYLPAGAYGALALEGSTGDTVIPSDFTFASARVKGATGDVDFRASVTGALEIARSTGDVRVQNVSVGSMKISTSTGEIEVKSAVCAADAEIFVSTGDAELTDVQCGSLTSDGSTGDLELERVIANGKMTLERSTGDVELNACDASELWIKTDTGNVKGSLLSPKYFRASSDTGRIRVPDTRTGGICEIATDTGNITFTLCQR